jgi:hypothetical protein
MRALTIMLIVCSLSGCAMMHDPNFWAAMAGGAANSAHATADSMRAQQEQTQRMIQQSQALAPAPTTCTSTAYSPGTVTTTCR